jgi:hypothetical protein
MAVALTCARQAARRTREECDCAPSIRHGSSECRLSQTRVCGESKVPARMRFLEAIKVGKNAFTSD